MPNLVSLTISSLQILGKTQMVVFPISGQSLTKENCHNSRASNDIDMKLEAAINKNEPKKIWR